MKIGNTLLTGAVVALVAVSHATELTYDLGVGFEHSAVKGQVGPDGDINSGAAVYASPRVDLGVKAKLNDDISAFARLAGIYSSNASAFSPNLDIKTDKEIQAMAGFSYKIGTTDCALGPVASFAKYTIDDASPVRFNGLGLSGSVDVRVEKLGVRFYTQYLINDQIFAASGHEVGNLDTNVTKVGVSIYGDKQTFA